MCVALRKTKDGFSRRKRRLSSSRFGAGHLGLAGKLIKKSAVMDHRLAQIFGGGLAAGMANGDPVRSSVVLDEQGMIHGDIRGTLFKIAGGIAAGGHDVAEEFIS